jgi:hypothetical protein
VVQSGEERKNGYSLFLELYEEFVKKHYKLTKHYGFSPEKMLSLAKEGSK